MNKFQKEQEEIFGQQKLSEERKSAVIDTVRTPQKRKSSWLPAVAVTCAIGIGSFLLLVPSEEQQTEEEIPTEQDFKTAATLEQLTKQIFLNNEFEIVKIVQPFLKDQGALVINKKPLDGSDKGFYEFLYAEKLKDGNWEHKANFPYFSQENSWLPMVLEGQEFFYGVLTDDTVERIRVGMNDATIWEVDGGTRIWFAQTKSNHTPVYFERNGVMAREKLFFSNDTTTIPFIEANKEEQSIKYHLGTMYRGNYEYTEFPLLIDPYYYAENPYKPGDVVLIETPTGSEVTRIIDTQQNQLVIDESTIIIAENYNSNAFYLAANYDGDTTIYVDERKEFPMTQPDEVFVHPDNWSLSSSSTRGPIKKESIIGYVLGYDLHGVTNTMTQQDLNLFEVVQGIVRDMKTTKYKENPLNEFLKTASERSVAKLYFYAHYVEDYETMYALFAKENDALPPYDEWLETVKLVTTPSSKQRLLVSLYAVDHMTMNTEKKRLEWQEDTGNQIVFPLPMEKEEGIWKVTYDTNKRN